MAIARSGNPEMSIEYRGGGIPVLGESISYVGSKTGRVYTLDTLYSDTVAFKEAGPQYTVAQYEMFRNYTKVFPNRDEEKSFLRIAGSLEHRKTLAVLARYQDEVVGHGIFPRYNYDYDTYMYSSRAIQKDYEKDGLGMEMWRIALNMHQSMIGRNRFIRGIYFMTMTAVSIRSLEVAREAGIMSGTIFPLEMRYGQSSEAQSAMLAGFTRFRLTAEELNVGEEERGVPQELGLNNGIVKNELAYLGNNENFTLMPGTRTTAIHRVMFKLQPGEKLLPGEKPPKENFGMVPGDVMLVLLLRGKNVNGDTSLNKAA